MTQDSPKRTSVVKNVSIQVIDMGLRLPPKQRYLANTSDYPVINGRGATPDEAMEDLIMALHIHFHNTRKGLAYEYGHRPVSKG